ncbi:MAG: flagellar basal body-associated FliL family protein [Symbiobacteriaceae bacterium]|nr:flagellar basal body-associated FliL family protein [Symbiobacteriaceae bacterium]
MKSTVPRMVLTVVLIIALSAVISTVSFTAFYYFVTRSETAANNENGTEPPALTQQAVLKEYDMGEVTVDLADKRFVRLTMVLLYPEIKVKTFFGLREAVDETLPNTLASNHNQIKHAVNTILRSHNSTELRGPELDRVMADILLQVNRILQTRYGVVSILFPEFVIS